MATLLGIQNAYKYSLQDAAGILEQVNGIPPSPSNDVRDKAIAEAINYYSARLPRIRTVLLSASADGFYPLPDDWQDYSSIVSIESPIDQIPPLILQKKRIGFAPTETISRFFLNPNVDADFRLTYTTVHGGGADSVASIPASHEQPIGKLAASVAMIEFASNFAKTVSNNVDAVNYRTKEQEARSVAKALRDQFEDEIQRAEWSTMFATDPDARYNKGWR